VGYFLFLSERCNCIASSAIRVRCCLSSSSSSVTRVYCNKMAEARIMQFSLKLAQCLSSLLDFLFLRLWSYHVQAWSDSSPVSTRQSYLIDCCSSTLNVASCQRLHSTSQYQLIVCHDIVAALYVVGCSLLPGTTCPIILAIRLSIHGSFKKTLKTHLFKCHDT